MAFSDIIRKCYNYNILFFVMWKDKSIVSSHAK
ncbi:hypothetical protein EDF84_102268 [Erwinia rhapontici]|nr:hypothetical protein EDF84_102268 [Erwinia rhapontici]